MSNILRKFRRGATLLGELIKYEAAALCAGVLKVTNPRYRHVWLVSERGREARDNGYHYFAYLRQAHPEINAVYVADPKLPDYDRVAQLGSVVPYRSWRHYLLCAASEMKVSTHVSGYTPDIERYYMLDKLHIVRGKKVFLQHGIMIDDMKWYHYPNVVMDLFVTTLQKERDFVESAFGYPKGVVRRLGLCRYDALLHPHETKRQVLFMPTWRTYAVEGKTQAEFEQTDYFQHWQAVISDPKLEKLLTKYGYDAVFYPHFEVQRFLSAFHTENPHVKIGALGQMDVQTLLMESALLITDFSSIQFDFAYMLKPEIYYQFDEARYWGTLFRLSRGRLRGGRDDAGGAAASHRNRACVGVRCHAGNAEAHPRYLRRARRPQLRAKSSGNQGADVMKANDGQANLILLDSAPQPEWNFAALMEAETGKKWNIWHIDSHFSDSAWKKKAKFFLFPLKVLRHRKEFGTILSYQQFYGLFFAFYSAIFHLKKHCHLIVTTFIYRPKQGWKGKLYAWFMRKAVNSPALDKIVCFSSSEPAYYQSIFGTDKFTYVPLGLGDLNRGGYIPQGEERFILAAGKSNRDYDFLVDALKDTPYQVRILSDAYNHPNPGSNIRIYHDVFGEKYYQMLSECCCVIVPLADARISAGQLVFLQAMMFAKPIITTESDTVRDYIESGKNGLIIPKQRDALRDAVRRLYEDEALYRGMAKEGRCRFLESYSVASMARRIGSIWRKLDEKKC